ncbi:hypothetical protein [uncultured Chryseobacterium sp.]|uniref:YobI family P-loop NTPase n=1 Tax=uncultured Chryseobacterium sp. TaxID=259322 RepID=UPI0025D5865D|nr:hypothetical protein [uncultured Chryseobacterium sp.]
MAHTSTNLESNQSNTDTPSASVSDEENSINSKQENIESNYKLEILSPVDKKNDPRIKKYLKHIKDAIDNKDVKNLALSGVYGSGKSTIIKSFKSQYPETTILHISLASFNEIQDGSYDKFKDQIQLNILQQIIYSQKADKLPESRINRISEINIWEKSNWIKVASFLVLFISTYLLLKFYAYQINPNNWKLSESFSWSCFALIVFSLISMFSIGKIAIEIVKNLKVNKITLKEAEFGNKNENKDILNKHIDEILYFFEKIPTNIVVIEDLDRFNTTEIYRTLREVNFLLNTYLENLKNESLKKVTFLYAIKDDLFLNELDRTKFFDLIIPAIPFVNYSNSKNVLSSKLDEIFKDDEVFEKPSKEFINTVSTFITDNRTLLNIINEFIIYKEQQKIQIEELNPEKLLALIIYKNLRPNDFSRLHTRKSNIDVIFTNKNELIKEAKDDIDSKITKIENDIIRVKNDNLLGVKELNTIFLFHIKEKIANSHAQGLIVDSENPKKIAFRDIINRSFDLSELYETEIKYFQQNYPSEQSLNILLDKIDATVGYNYADKYDLIINKDSKIIQFENQIKLLRRELNGIENKTLNEIFKTKDLSKDKLKVKIDKFYLGSIIEEKDRAYNDSLLIFLLENGYIDEHYREYISTFQKGGLNETDHEFKINIISKIHEPKPIDYNLADVEDIIEELPINYFQDSRILNIELIDYLIVHKAVYPDKLQSIFLSISEWNNKRIKQFLSVYLYKGNRIAEMIDELAKNWNELWSVIKSDSNFIEDDKKQILYILLDTSEDVTLISLNKNRDLSNYISENIDILFDFQTDKQLNRIKEILSDNVLNVKFRQLASLPESLKKLFNLIYENNRYEINIDNIGTFIESKCDLEFDLDRFNKSNLSYIYDCELDELINYLEKDNFNSYIDNVYSVLENEQFNEEENTVKVLNNEELSIEKKSIFIEKQINPISDITKLKRSSYYDIVIAKKKIRANWENVYQYYWQKDNIFNANLIKLLNETNVYYELSSEKISLNVDDEMQNEFILKLISNDDLTNTSYQTIVRNSIPDDFEIPEDFDFKIIDENKIKELIHTEAIPLTESHFEALKAVRANLHINLLLKNWIDYLEYVHEFGLSVEDKILVLQYDDLSDILKLSIIKNQISDEDLEDNDLTEKVTTLLLKNSSSSMGILDFNKLKTMLTHKLRDEQKIKLINLLSDKLSKDNILDIQINIPESHQVHPRSQMMLENNNFNKEFIKILKSVKIAGESKDTKNNEIRVWLLDYTR